MKKDSLSGFIYSKKGSFLRKESNGIVYKGKD